MRCVTVLLALVAVVVLPRGARACDGVICLDTPNYVCANDGTTYLNACYVRRQSCLTSNASLAVAYTGICAGDTNSYDDE